MKKYEITSIRLTNQHIAGNKLTTVKELVSDMGAIQSQDYEMSKWAIGLRISYADEQLINKAIDEGDIIRTHLLRPTWHFVASEDLNWMRELTAPAIKASMKSRNRELGLTNEILRKSRKIFSKILRGDNSLTREQLIFSLNKANIRTDENRASHIFMDAELEGIICSGRTDGRKPTYALIEDRIHKTKSIKGEEAIATLARIYFSSRGPASLVDFAWWSGLTSTKIKNAFGWMNAESVQMELQKFWKKNFQTLSIKPKRKLNLLPSFDEYVLSYKDRSSFILQDKLKKIISSNGLFRPLIIENGIAVGIWKRTFNKNRVLLDAEFFKPINEKLINSLKKETKYYSKFLGKEVVLNSVQSVKII